MGTGLLHSCEVCSSSFARKGDLTRHSYTHEDIKPYRCKVCSKGFSQSSGLKTHMNTHSGNKPFRCSFNGCSARFGDPSSCARHEKEIHRRMVPYRCPDPYCSSRIKRRSSFADHLKSKHGINADVVNIDAFAPPLLPALAKQRKTRRKSLKVITDIPATDESMEPLDLNHGGLSSACSETPSPDIFPRGSNLDNLHVPLYSEAFEDFFETKPFYPLDSPVDFASQEQLLHPICSPPYSLSTSVKSAPLQTPAVRLSLNALQYANSMATRDVVFDLNSLPFGLGRIDLFDFSSMKSWS